MGSPTIANLRVEFELALSVGAYRAARRSAALLGELDPIDTLRLTVLAGRRDPERFDRLARDWIGEAIGAGAIGVADVRWIAPLLHGVGAGRRRDGERLLLLMRHRGAQ